ncbi:hypothetical protein LXL04_026788 [Taraxacum kok-saghyz]
MAEMDEFDFMGRWSNDVNGVDVRAAIDGVMACLWFMLKKKEHGVHDAWRFIANLFNIVANFITTLIVTLVFIWVIWLGVFVWMDRFDPIQTSESELISVFKPWIQIIQTKLRSDPNQSNYNSVGSVFAIRFFQNSKNSTNSYDSNVPVDDIFSIGDIGRFIFRFLSFFGWVENVIFVWNELLRNHIHPLMHALVKFKVQYTDYIDRSL